MVEINSTRLLQDLRRVAEFGRYKTGVHRPTFSKQDIEARRWLANRMSEAGLDTSIDGVGNVLGRTKSSGPKLLTGSHCKSQNYSGWLDGILGVIYGIETAHALKEADARFGIDVGVWADEETHFLQFLGSRSFIGDLTENEIDRATNKDDGTPLRQVLRECGLAHLDRFGLDQARYLGYLEAHIEQGYYLDQAGCQIGIVTSIVGLWQYRLTFFGEQNHAGTTGMGRRKDAGSALVRFVNVIDARFREVARDRSVWTVGKIELDPGAPSIIPGKATMLFQFRDDEVRQLELFERTMEEIIDEVNRSWPCRCEVTVIDRAVPMVMDSQFQDALEAAARARASHNYMRMPSGAMHDAQIMAKRMRAGMMFVPSIDGVSHHYSENTTDEDIVNGCRVFADAIEILLSDRQ